MRTTLGDLKNQSGLLQSVGFNRCQPELVQLVNAAQQELANAGKWWGSYARMRICITDGCIAWPREVMTVEGFNMCGWSIPIRNAWFEFQTYVRAPSTRCQNDCNLPQMLERGVPPLPQYRQFLTASTIRMYPNAADVGKRILIQGLDVNGIRIRTVDLVTGAVVYGEYVTLALPFAESATIFQQPALSGVQKPITDYDVTVTAADATTGVETEIAVWQPSETNPAYRRYFVTNRPRCGTNNWNCRDHGDGCRPSDETCLGLTAEVLYRVQFMPALVDSDWLYISNLSALERQMVSVQQRRQNEYDDAEMNHKIAIRFLRQELEAYSPSQNMVVTQLPEGTAKFNRVFGQWSI